MTGERLSDPTDDLPTKRTAECIDCTWSGDLRECGRKTVTWKRRTGTGPFPRNERSVGRLRPPERPRPPRPGVAPVCPECGGWVGIEKVEVVE